MLQLAFSSVRLFARTLLQLLLLPLLSISSDPIHMKAVAVAVNIATSCLSFLLMLRL